MTYKAMRSSPPSVNTVRPWQELSADIYTAHCSIYVQNSQSQSGGREKFQTVALSLLVIVMCRLLTLFGTAVSFEMLAAL